MLASQVRDKLLDLEQKLKSKATQISQLEMTLENLLSSRSTQFSDTQSFEQICQDSTSLKMFLQSLKRAISKLKIELHADYLTLGQINISCGTPREEVLDHPPTTREAHNIASIGSFAPNGYLASTMQINSGQSTELANFNQIFT
jgi:hypothetical protein